MNWKNFVKLSRIHQIYRTFERQQLGHLRCERLLGCMLLVACCISRVTRTLEDLSLFHNARIILASISTNTLVILTVISMCLLSTFYVTCQHIKVLYGVPSKARLTRKGNSEDLHLHEQVHLLHSLLQTDIPCLHNIPSPLHLLAPQQR